jgi:hypothetical protein
VRQADPAVGRDVDPGIVRPTVGHRVAHAEESLLLDPARAPSELEDPADAAHRATPSSLTQ